MLKYTLINEEESRKWGEIFATRLIQQSIFDQKGITVYLSGALGSGKTTLAQGIMKGLDFQGVVSSPTFDIIRIYETEKAVVVHTDLYRFNHSTLCLTLDLESYQKPQHVLLIEWPEHGNPYLPPPDVTLQLFDKGVGQQRQLTVTHLSITETVKNKI